MAEASALLVEVRTSPEASDIDRDRLAELLRFAAAEERVGGELGVWICSDAEIADLHQQFMSIPGPTDVLSFPSDPTDPSDDYLGDIAVSFETAAEQGRGAGNTPAREVAYLALHGFLHLLGYDDLDPANRRRMIARQDALLHAFEGENGGGWD